MNTLVKNILLVLTAFLSTAATAQNITGSWKGFLPGEYLEINIQQKGNELCGYTYDYEINSPADHCKANFMGRYDPDKKIWYLSGTSFLENSGTHVLMRIILWRDPDDKDQLLGKLTLQSRGLLSLFGAGADDLLLTKSSRTPKNTPGLSFPCFPEPQKTKVNKKTPQKQEDKKAAPVKPITTAPKPVNPETPKPVAKDTVKKVVVTPKQVEMPKAPSQLEKLMTSRKQNTQSRIAIDVDELNLKVYDNGTVDNDTVSIFYNGRLLLSHQRLSEKPIELKIKLDPSTTQHAITMFAENLGSIPPNTALIVVMAGNKRYELRSTASLEENAVLVFDYVPK